MSMSIEAALAAVDDSLPDGAWMEALCELTGLDAGDVSAKINALYRRAGRKLDRMGREDLEKS